VTPFINGEPGTFFRKINNKRKPESVTLIIIKETGFTSYIAPISGFNSEIMACSRPNQVTIASKIFKIVR
jgi:hypothetical protein